MFYDYVKRAAQGRWPEILKSICAFSEHQTTPTRKGMPCPHCGGTDRYEFKSAEDGFYLCRGCGAGDGWSMLEKRLGVDFQGAVEQVAQYLGITRDKNTPLLVNPVPTEKKNAVANLELRRYEAISRKASYIWNHSEQNPVNHPYLLKKRLSLLKLRQYGDSLVSQVYNQGHQLVNLQFIDKDGNKRFLRGGQTKGCYQWWGPLSWSVFVCEGVADALGTFLFHHETRLTIAAYSVSNMVAVGEHLRRLLPSHRLVLVLDNDAPTEERKHRPGVAALLAHHCFNDIILPPEGMDASDMWVRNHG